MDKLWRNARVATLAPGSAGLGMIERGAVGVVNGRIAFVGPEAQLPAQIAVREEIDLEGRLITPGLIDCHTHLIFAGDRCHEFELRLAGASYEAIAAAGGGVHSTVRATRAATEQELWASAEKRLKQLIADGVTTIEIKSGYGLELETELRMLRVARRLGQAHPIDVVTTLLAAHVVPVDRDRLGYLHLVTQEIIPRAAAEGLADAVDVFCETIAFTPGETRSIFQRARECGLRVKLHADQLSDSGGAALAAEFAALSADHLEWTSPAGAAALGRSGTVAVLLPGAFFNLRERQLPPLQALRQAGAHIAVATDCNPGTSPLLSILAAMNMAAVQFGLSVTEVIAAVTREAARALGRQAEVGSLMVGKRADMAIWDVETAAELVYWLGGSPLHARLWRGN